MSESDKNAEAAAEDTGPTEAASEDKAADKSATNKGKKKRGRNAEAEQTTAENEAPKPAGRNEIQLGKYITIDVTARLDYLDRPTAQAFGAVDSRTPNQPVYVLVCTGGKPPRLEALGALNRARGVPLVTPVDWGIVDWNPMGRDGNGERRYALVFEKPSQQPLAPTPDTSIQPMREEQIVERVMIPLVKVLRELDSRGLTHRAISTNNLFGADGAASGVLLGECVSAPAGMLQPAIYETIDAAQSLPAGRGPGSIADDLYALGVLIAILLRGNDPSAGANPDDIVARKIERGSYAAVMENARASLKLMEPLRGLLCDRIEERWDLDALESWMNGRYQSPKQPSLPPKARRAFKFMNKDYWTCPGLAHALAQTWSDAVTVISDGDLEQWVNRSLTDEKQAKLLQAVLASARGDESSDGTNRTLARTLIALDPAAPIRMRDFSARIDSLAQLLAIEYHDANIRNAFVQVLQAKLPQRWLEMQPVQRGDHPQAVNLFERMVWYIERDQPGYGLERVLYEFNPGWPCQSELIGDSYVSDVADILPALEARAAADIPDRSPIDRHIAAFVGANMKPSPDRQLQGLGQPKPEHHAAALISLLAELQRRYGPQSLPALTEWVARRLTPLTDSLHNRDLIEKVRRRIKRAVDAGSLTELRAAVADQELRRRDADGFARARQQYAKAAREITWLEDGGLTSDKNVAWATRNTATAISAVCSGLLVVVLTVFYAS